MRMFFLIFAHANANSKKTCESSHLRMRIFGPSLLQFILLVYWCYISVDFLRHFPFLVQVCQFSPAVYEWLQCNRKGVVLVLNKVDLVPASLVTAWKNYFTEHYPQLQVITLFRQHLFRLLSIFYPYIIIIQVIQLVYLKLRVICHRVLY